MRGNLTPRRPLLRWIVLVGVLLAIPISYVVGQKARDRALGQLRNRAADQVEIQLTYLRSQMDSLYTLTRLVGADERIGGILADPSNVDRQRQINQYLERVLITTRSIAYVMNGDGQVVASGNWRAHDSFVGADLSFRPYFKEALEGHLSQFVAKGTISNRLGYYVAVPIWHQGHILGVAATKTETHRLILPRNLQQAPFFITEENGIAVISSSRRLLYRHLRLLAATELEQLQQGRQFYEVDIKPLTHAPVQTLNGIHLLTPADDLEPLATQPARQYILAAAPVPATGWTAHILWPVHNLNNTLVESLVITMLVIVAALLLTLFAVERWRHMRQMHEQAMRDPLTQLYTRLYMLESATLLLAAHDRQSISGVTAVMLDLDRFKEINDRFGHSAGDRVLVAAAAVIHRECRDTDVAIRYGGEELLIFLPTADQQEGLHLAQRIRRKIKQLDLLLDGRQVHLTLSGGIAIHRPGESLEKLINRADRMLYKAKAQGRDRVVWEAQPSSGQHRIG